MDRDLIPTFGGVSLMPQGAMIYKSLSYEEWESAFSTFTRINDAARWAIGDLVNYGERFFPDRYTQVLDATGMAYQTIANYAWIAGAYLPEERVNGASWSKHRAVAAVEDRVERRLLLEGGKTIAELTDGRREGRVRETNAPAVAIAAEIVSLAKKNQLTPAALREFAARLEGLQDV